MKEFADIDFDNCNCRISTFCKQHPFMSYSPSSPLISRLASTNLGNELGKHIGKFPKLIRPMCVHTIKVNIDKDI